MEKQLGLKIQIFFGEMLEMHYARLAAATAMLGLVFGLGFLLGSLYAPGPLKRVTPKDALSELAQKEEKYTQVQNQVKLTYYAELLQRPKTEPAEQANFVPEASTALVLESEPELPALKPNALTNNNQPSSKRMAEALVHVLGNDTPGSVHEAIQQALPTSTGSAFAIQIASLPSKETAEILRIQMQKKGYDARLVQAEIAGKKIVYRLRIHGFNTRKDAEDYLQKNRIEGIAVAQ
jgi:cell division septation protein DedD